MPSTLSVCVLLVVSLLAATACAGVEARRPHHAHNHAAARESDPHPLTDAHNIDAKFARINSPLSNRTSSLGRTRVGGGSVYGVDISQFASQSVLSCFIDQGMEFAIVRGYQSSCEVDPEGVHSVANAWAVGMEHVDIYLFPSFECGDSAATQVANTIANMGTIKFGTLWLDIEASGSGWSSDVGENQAWLAEAIEEAKNQLGSGRVGIYSSAYGWSVAMGDWEGASGLPLWYAHYDDNPSFSDFSSFGGWDSPAMKQYEGDQTVCGFGVDLNYYS